MQLTLGDFDYLGLCLEGFFFGIYSGVFALHLQIHASRKDSEPDSRKQNIVFHALWVLFVLSAAVIALYVAAFVVNEFNNDDSLYYHLNIAHPVVFGFCDFIAQSILIHRCWIVWGHNNRVVIIPLVLAFAYFVMWIAGAGLQFIGQGQIFETESGDILFLTSLTASMTVNALVTGLIVFRIFKVFRQVKSLTTPDETSLGITGGTKLHSIIFVIIESGMALFSIQLARLVIAFLNLSITAENVAYPLIANIHEMLNGITPTIILVRVSMGLSFHDGPSLVEAVSSLQFAADHPNPIVGRGSLSEDGNLGIEPDDLNADDLEMVNISQETRRRDNDDRSDEIQMVDR